MGSTSLKNGNHRCHVSCSKKRCHVAQAAVQPRRPHTRQHTRRTGRLPNPPRRWRLLDSVHRLQTRRLVPLLPAPGSHVAVVPAEAASDVLQDAPRPAREPTAEQLALAAKKRQIADMRQKLDQVTSRHIFLLFCATASLFCIDPPIIPCSQR